MNEDRYFVRWPQESSFGRDIANIISYGIIFNVGLVAAYYLFQSYGQEIWYAVKFVAVANLCVIGAWYAAPKLGLSRYVGITILAAVMLGVGASLRAFTLCRRAVVVFLFPTANRPAETFPRRY